MRSRKSTIDSDRSSESTGSADALSQSTYTSDYDHDDDNDDVDIDDNDGDSDATSFGDDSTCEEEEDDDEEKDNSQHAEDDVDRHVPIGLKLQKLQTLGKSRLLHESRQRKAHTRELSFSKQQQEEKQQTAMAEATTAVNTRPDTRTKSCTDKRKSKKHAPVEVSSQRKEFFRRQRQQNVNESGIGVRLASNFTPRDPRWSKLSSSSSSTCTLFHNQKIAAPDDMDRVERNYAFLNELREQEIVQLKRRIRARETTGSTGRHLRHRLGIMSAATSSSNTIPLDDDRKQLKWLQHSQEDMERRRIDRIAQQTVKKQQQQRAQASEEVSEQMPAITNASQDPENRPQFSRRGKNPARVYVSRAKQKQQFLEAKYAELRKRRGDATVEQAVAKRLKKQNAKSTQRRRRPFMEH